MSARAAYIAKLSNYDCAMFYIAEMWDAAEVYGNPSDRIERILYEWARCVGLSEQRFWRHGQ